MLMLMRQSYLFFFFLLLVSHSRASFDTLTCTSRNECVIPRDSKYCYNPNQSTRPRDDSICSSSSYQNVMAVHIASARSIGYYDKQTLKFVGDWSWTVIRSVYLCVSGQLTDGTYQSWCSSTSSNNDFGYGGCVVAIGQPYVADGCYTPDTSAAAVQVASSIGGGSPSPSSSGSGSGSSTGGDGSQGGPFTPSRGSHRSVLPTALALLFSVLTSVTIMI